MTGSRQLDRNPKLLLDRPAALVCRYHAAPSIAVPLQDVA